MDIPLWFVFALGAAIFSGLNNFFKKVSAENKNDSKVVAFYFNLFSAVISFCVFLIFSKDSNIDTDWIFWGSVSAIAVGHVFNLVYKMKGLKYLNASTFFVALKFGMISTLFLLEIFIFDGAFTLSDLLGLIIGFGALLLLVDKSNHIKKQYLTKGVVAIIICVAVMTMSSGLRKNVALIGYDRYAYYFYIFFLSFLVTAAMNYREITSGAIFNNKRGTIFYPFLQASFNFVAQISGFMALVYGANLAIYAKVSAYSIFIPIMLSIIIYKEKVTVKKLVAFGLTVISLWLFL